MSPQAASGCRPSPWIATPLDAACRPIDAEEGGCLEEPPARVGKRQVGFVALLPAPRLGRKWAASGPPSKGMVRAVSPLSAQTRG